MKGLFKRLFGSKAEHDVKVENALVDFLAELDVDVTSVPPQPFTEQEARDVLELGTESGRIGHSDWKDAFEDVVWNMDQMLEILGRPSFSQMDPGGFAKLAAQYDRDDELPLPDAFDGMRDLLKGAGLELLHVQTFSDEYCYTVVSPAFFTRWVDKTLAPGVATEG